MPVFMDYNMAIWESSGIRKCAVIEKQKKIFIYGIEKTKYIVIRTGDKKKKKKLLRVFKWGRCKEHTSMTQVFNEKETLEDHNMYKNIGR